MIEPTFLPGQVVYLKHDPDYLPRMLIAYTVSQTSIRYNLISGTVDTWHYGIEITTEQIKKPEVGLGKKN